MDKTKTVHSLSLLVLFRNAFAIAKRVLIELFESKKRWKSSSSWMSSKQWQRRRRCLILLFILVFDQRIRFKTTLYFCAHSSHLLLFLNLSVCEHQVCVLHFLQTHLTFILCSVRISSDFLPVIDTRFWSLTQISGSREECVLSQPNKVELHDMSMIMEWVLLT